ncbi:hypothetical protein GUJ74_25155, partial
MTQHHRHAEELDRARAEAERAHAIKGRVPANVTHAPRTPLNAVSSTPLNLPTTYPVEISVVAVGLKQRSTDQPT